MSTFKGNSKQDGRGPDMKMDPTNDIIDIRRSESDGWLHDELKKCLGGNGNARSPTFPDLILWDERGLDLFEKITYSEDYYLTNTEIGILEEHSRSIAMSIAPNSMVVDLGSGNLRKIKILLQALDDLGRTVDYYALDVSEPALERSLEQIPPGIFKHVKCHGLLGTYDDGQAWLQKVENVHRPKCIVSLGSTIGSFSGAGAVEFLSNFRQSLNCKASLTKPSHAGQSYILVGLDACTDEKRIRQAYGDAAGLNSEFILNALDHANKMLGSNRFSKSDWTVQGEWNKANGSHDQYLVPKKTVKFDDVVLEAHHKIYIVSSMKYDAKQQARLWMQAGLVESQRWSNENKSYGIHLLEPLDMLN